MATQEKYNSKFLFYGLILYTVIYYTQIAGRYPILAPFRVEFVVGTILLIVIGWKIFSKEIDLSENKINFYTIIFFTVCGITIPFAIVKSRAVEEYISLIKFFSIYLMIISCINTERRLKIFFYVYLAMISLLFVEPFFLSLKGEGFRYNNHMMRLYGVTGFFEHPNQLGGITSANLPFFYFMAQYHKSISKKILFCLLIAVATYVIMLTQSRTAFMGVIFFVLLAFIQSKHKLLMFLAAICFCLVAWQFAPEQTKSRFLTLGKTAEVISSSEGTYVGNKELGSINSRWILITRSTTMFLENPIVGVGIGCYPSASGRRWGQWMPTHNLYTQALSEIGLVGTISFMYVLLCVYKNIKETKEIAINNSDKSLINYINEALFMFLIIRLIIGFFGHDLYRNWWWIAAGLSVVTLRVANSRYPSWTIINKKIYTNSSPPII